MRMPASSYVSAAPAIGSAPVGTSHNAGNGQATAGGYNCRMQIGLASTTPGSCPCGGITPTDL